MLWALSGLAYSVVYSVDMFAVMKVHAVSPVRACMLNAGKDLRQAIDRLLQGQPLVKAAKPSLGCGIKWHPAKQPA